ncbi:MAG TPA: TetR family transcriptional regulator [Actinomycetota bacterium]|nr:TetR family transcriptional regulator [Actinomycetota bacterium]
MGSTATPSPKAEAHQALLDAAERLLVESGAAGVTTRRVAQEAGVNHGLVHYYFGSIENLVAEVLERFTDKLLLRQRAMYAADAPFVDKWRAAMSYMDQDHESGYHKIWLELHAMAWNRPELRERVARVTAEWRSVLAGALETAAREYGLRPAEAPVAAITALIETATIGTMMERHIGVTTGHAELLAEIERRLERLERKKGSSDAGTASGRGRVRRP